MIEVRKYQTEAIHEINRLLNSRRNPVYLAPCGTGKTFTAARIIEDRIRLKRRVFVIVPQVEIFDEWMRVLVSAGLNPGYINDEGIRGQDRGVYVCMALSLLNALPYVPHGIYPDEIITDEMQHSLADSWETIYEYFPQATRLGLTATLYHGSLRSFEHLYTDIVQTITKSEAIAQGFITKPLLVVPEQWAGKVPKNGDDFDRELQAEILGKPKVVGRVVDYYGETFGGKPVIVPCATYEHANYMTEAFNEAGWTFAHLHSKLAKHERKRILRAVARGELNGICTVGIGIEGMSIHGLYGVLWLRRTLSPIIWTQFNGRAERIAGGKEYWICADFVGNSVIHGMPDRDLFWHLRGELDAEADAEAEKAPAMRTCPVCGVINAWENTVCHFCGSDMQDAEAKKQNGRGMISMVDGNLVAVISEEDRHRIRETVTDIKEEIKREAEKKVEAITIDDREKLDHLRKNLFAGNRRALFHEAIKNFMK